jgi:hypothetical protein
MTSRRLSLWFPSDSRIKPGYDGWMLDVAGQGDVTHQ